MVVIENNEISPPQEAAKKQRRREIYTTALKHQMVYGTSSGKSNKFALAGEESSRHFPGWASSLKMRSTAGGLESLPRGAAARRVSTVWRR